MDFPISVLPSGSIVVFRLTRNVNVVAPYFQAAARLSDSQTNPTISRAQATFTLFGCLPASSKRLPFLVSRRKQRSAIATNSGALFARRALRSLPSRAER